MVLKLYNGCPNDELKAIWDSRDAALKRLHSVDKKAWVTYFPVEGGYMASTWNPKFKCLSTNMHSSVESAVEEAIGILNA